MTHLRAAVATAVAEATVDAATVAVATVLTLVAATNDDGSGDSNG